MTSTVASDVAEIKDRLGHPIVDGDGHLVESLPFFLGYVERLGGAAAPGRVLDAIRDLTSDGDASRGDQRSTFWGFPTVADDLATVMAPKLLAERMDEIGLDFTVLYPTLGLGLPTIPDDDLRRLACRALNTMNAEATAPVARWMTPAASIPMHSPEEALAELAYAVRELGFKVACIPPAVARPWPAFPDAFPTAQWADRFGIDSAYDYDPVWQGFCDLGIPVTSHGGVGLRYLEVGRRSPTSYMCNHILGHAYQQEELCKALVLGGVPRRFPNLRFGFLEGGAGWAADLLHSLEEHWEKRSAVGLGNYDPARLDRERLDELLARHGMPPGGRLVGFPKGAVKQPVVRDEFEDCGITSEEQFGEVFERQFFFGCEADDRSVYRALDGKGNPFGSRLNAFFSSDIGHWDVPDITRVVPESRKLVEVGLLTDDDYRDFVFTHPVDLYAGMNPRFFEGTNVETAVAESC